MVTHTWYAIINIWPVPKGKNGGVTNVEMS